MKLIPVKPRDAKKRSIKSINGWISIDKPSGLTATQVTAKVKHHVRAAKAGHAGTLDPLATGVLPIALGEATKTVSFVMGGRKRYTFTIGWGSERTTDDLDGEITRVSDYRPNKNEILKVLPQFTGNIDQVPPKFSAVKIGGHRAYNLARAGVEISLNKRCIFIEKFALLNLPSADLAVFEVMCGKGTYIRSLARDIGRRLNTAAHVKELRRTHCGPFSELHSISLESLKTLVHSAPPSAYLHSVETALDDIPAVVIDLSQADHLRHGRPIRVRTKEGCPCVDIDMLVDGDVLCAKAGGQLVALARLTGDEIRAFRVFNI
ncbi:MAG: tRNA pseudouridine(55) synthase TruB [Rhodospirillaceae bacterium]|nr:tRNA pseudouridine(55) synthase TruB [Rhodospirillaceae bacterium]